MQYKFVLPTILGLSLLAPVSPALACACCTESGQRMDTIDPIEGYVLGELVQVRFAATGNLYAGPGFPDDIQGLVNPADGPYRVRAAIQQRDVIFEFVDPAGKAGRVQFAMPRQLARFEVDPRGGEDASHNGPALYKEWRLSGPARLSGIAAAGGAVARATLVLHGGGNSCTSAFDFTHWTLNVAGRGVKFTFLGQLRR